MGLIIKNLHARYDSSQVLFGIDMEVPPGEIVTLLGRNGMGKSTTVKSIMGMIPNRTGHIEFNGKPICHMESHDIVRQGIGLVPEGRHIFPTLTVRENLIATASNRGNMKDPWTVDKVVDMFPNLGKRMANDGWQGDSSRFQADLPAAQQYLGI